MLTPALILGPQAGASRSEAPAALGVVAEAAEAGRGLSNGVRHRTWHFRGRAQLQRGPTGTRAHHPELQSRTLCNL